MITVTWLDVNTQHREHREKHVMWMSSMSSVQLWGKATRKVRHSTLLQHCQSSAWPFRLESGAWLEPSMKPRQSWRANPWNGRQLAGDSTRIESIVQTCSDGSFQENGKKCRKRRSNEKKERKKLEMNSSNDGNWDFPAFQVWSVGAPLVGFSDGSDNRMQIGSTRNFKLRARYPLTMQFFEAGVFFILFLDKMRLWNHLAGKSISLYFHARAWNTGWKWTRSLSISPLMDRWISFD